MNLRIAKTRFHSRSGGLERAPANDIVLFFLRYTSDERTRPISMKKLENTSRVGGKLSGELHLALYLVSALSAKGRFSYTLHNNAPR